jgi:hypothetical protein
VNARRHRGNGEIEENYYAEKRAPESDAQARRTKAIMKAPRRVKLEAIQPRALSLKDAAAYIGLSPKTLRNRTGPRAPNPFPVKPRYYGGKPLFLVDELNAFLESLPTSGGEQIQ